MVGKNCFLIFFGGKFTSMHFLSVHYIDFLFFGCFLTPPLSFSSRFLKELQLMDSLKKKTFLGGEIHKINLGRTCFDRVGRKSETNNIFFRPQLEGLYIF